MSRMIRHIIPMLFPLLMSSFGLKAQEAKALIKKGNENYHKNEFEQAADQYKKSIEMDPELLESYFNLGDAMYRQEKYDEAARYFNMVAERAKDKDLKAKAYHNLGNSLVKQQKLKEGVESYKQSLINNPTDDETRFNLAYSMRKLMQKKEEEKKQQEKEEQKQQQQEQQQEQEQEQNKEQQEKEEQQEKQQEEQQQQQEQEQQEQQQQEQQQQQQQKHEVSREEANRMLEALENKEKKVQGQLKKKEVKSSEINIEKNW